MYAEPIHWLGALKQISKISAFQLPYLEREATQSLLATFLKALEITYDSVPSTERLR